MEKDKVEEGENAHEINPDGSLRTTEISSNANVVEVDEVHESSTNIELSTRQSESSTSVVNTVEQDEIKTNEGHPKSASPTADSLAKLIYEALLRISLNPEAKPFSSTKIKEAQGHEGTVNVEEKQKKAIARKEETQEHSEYQQSVPSCSQTSVIPQPSRNITTDLRGRPRFRPIVPYAWPNEYNLAPNEGNIRNQWTRDNPESGDPNGTVNNENNTDTLNPEYVDYSTYDPSVEPYYNIYFNPYMDNYSFDPNFGQNFIPVYPENYYLDPLNGNYVDDSFNPNNDPNELDNNVDLPFQSTSYQPEYIPEGFSPYYPCMGNNSPIYIRNPDPELFSIHRMRSPRTFRNTSPDTNIASMRFNSLRHRKPNRVPLRYAHLYDEEEIYLLETMDLKEIRHRSTRASKVQTSDRGSQAMDLEEYMLIKNMSDRKNYICKSCSNLSAHGRNKPDGILAKDEQSKTYDLQNLATSVLTKSVGTLTSNLLTRAAKTQTDILDVKIPFKTIIPTKFATPKPSLISIASTGSIKSSQKSVRFSIPQKNESPEEESNDETPREDSSSESSTGGSNVESLCTTSQVAVVPQPPKQVQLSLVDADVIPIAPRRKLRRPGEPEWMTYAAVVGSSHSTTAESLRSKRTENIPSCSKTFHISQKPSTQPAALISRPFVPQRPNSRPAATNLVFLELTLNQRLLPNSLKNNFGNYLSRGLHFKSIGRDIILLIFNNESDAIAVLHSQCRIGNIVTIDQASERSKQVASRYKTLVERNNPSGRIFKSGYSK